MQSRVWHFFVLEKNPEVFGIMGLEFPILSKIGLSTKLDQSIFLTKGPIIYFLDGRSLSYVYDKIGNSIRGTLTSTKIPSLSNDTKEGSSEGTNLK